MRDVDDPWVDHLVAPTAPELRPDDQPVPVEEVLQVQPVAQEVSVDPAVGPDLVVYSWGQDTPLPPLWVVRSSNPWVRRLGKGERAPVACTDCPRTSQEPSTHRESPVHPVVRPSGTRRIGRCERLLSERTGGPPSVIPRVPRTVGRVVPPAAGLNDHDS